MGFISVLWLKEIYKMDCALECTDDSCSCGPYRYTHYLIGIYEGKVANISSITNPIVCKVTSTKAFGKMLNPQPNLLEKTYKLYNTLPI